MNKIMRLVLVALLVVMTLPVFALNTSNLSKAMDTAAYAGEYLNHLMHPGMPKPWTNPMFGEMNKRIGEAWKTITTEISSIETAKEVEAARAVVESYKASQGTYRDLGYQVEISLNERVKFLQVHGSL